VVLEAPGENLSSVGSGRRQRTRCYLVGGIALESFSSRGAAGCGGWAGWLCGWGSGSRSSGPELDVEAAAPN
jgi:hypothetical protein